VVGVEERSLGARIAAPWVVDDHIAVQTGFGLAQVRQFDRVERTD